jgi:opacity protein-like surface antigen
MSFRRSASTRPSYFFLISLILLSSAVFSPGTARAQDASSTPDAPTPRKLQYDGALSGFGQVTGASDGNFIREDTTESIGGLLSFRQEYRPWMGYEVNYGYTRYSESYNKGFLGRVQNNVNELTFAYLAQAHVPYGFQLFASLCGGIMIFDPTSKGGNGKSAQLLPAFTYSLGLNHNVLSDHIGIRVQYRYVRYKTPSFHEFQLDTQTLRRTMEPSIGVYYRF